MEKLEEIITIGSVCFRENNQIVQATFEPDNLGLSKKKGSHVIILRSSSKECIEDLHFYLLKNNKHWKDMPESFFDPFSK